MTLARPPPCPPRPLPKPPAARASHPVAPPPPGGPCAAILRPPPPRPPACGIGCAGEPSCAPAAALRPLPRPPCPPRPPAGSPCPSAPSGCAKRAEDAARYPAAAICWPSPKEPVLAMRGRKLPGFYSEIVLADTNFFEPNARARATFARNGNWQLLLLHPALAAPASPAAHTRWRPSAHLQCAAAQNGARREPLHRSVSEPPT